MANQPDPKEIQHLPVAAVFDPLKRALAERRSAVLVAPPGAGKTTTVPLALLDAPWLAGRRMVMLEPRRLAARAAAWRMADLLGERVGQTVGYRVRMDTRVGPDTCIEVVTEGVLTRMLQSDPSLAGVGLVIFDEFHERNLDGDLGLALTREIQGVLNEDLRLLIMSATLEAEPVAALLDNAPLVTCQGRQFPVETRYTERPQNRSMEQAVVQTIIKSTRTDQSNMLVFLPGAAEIRRTARLLEQAGLGSEWMVAPLFGNLTRDQQDAAIAPPPTGQRKIVLATPIAETSLTIAQVRVVVDSGLRRAPRFDVRSGLTRLVTLPISQASADQRRGRAGRTEPGVCYRLWSEGRHITLAPFNRPEILEADLAGPALELALWGIEDPQTLCWLDPPPQAAFTASRQLLASLGALDDKGKISPHGRTMAQVPLHPRLAHMVLMARDQGLGSQACELAAILSERDPLHFTARPREADLRLRLEALHDMARSHRATGGDYILDRAAGRRILGLASQLKKRLHIQAAPDKRLDPGKLLAWAYPDRIAQQRPGNYGHYLLASGRGAWFQHPDPLAAQDYLVAVELDGERQNARIFLAAAYDEATLLEQYEANTQWKTTIRWQPERQAVEAHRELILGALVLRRENLADPDPEQVQAALQQGIRHHGLDILPWTKNLRTWQARVQLLARLEAAETPWPDVSDIALLQHVDSWLGTYLAGMTRLKDLQRLNLKHALYSQLTPYQQHQLEEQAPTHFTVPSGSRIPIDYSNEQPILAVRLQEMFGATQTPTIANGRQPLLIHLLSPASRPVQVTQDLAGFWQGSYHEVKKDLKGRYPKHHWPDDPLNATPTARAKTKNKRRNH